MASIKYGFTEDGVRQEIFEYVDAYLEQHGKLPNLGIVARRFGKQVRVRFGKSLTELLSKDPRFVLNTLESGKTLVGAFPAESDVP